MHQAHLPRLIIVLQFAICAGLSLLVLPSKVNAQFNTVIIGENHPQAFVPSNSTAGPINIWFRSSKYRVHYSPQEIAATGISAGLLAGIGIDVFSVPTYALPDFTISVGSAPYNMLDQVSSADLEQVYSSSLFTPQAGGFNDFLFDQFVFFPGDEYLIVEFCFSQVPSFTSSGVVNSFAVQQSDINQYLNYPSRNIRADGSNVCFNEPTSNILSKPVLKLLLTGTEPNDLGVSRLLSTQYTCSGNYTPQVEVVNYGTNAVSQYQVQWKLNGILQSPFSVTTQLDTFGGSGKYRDTIALPSFAVAETENFQLKVWTQLPNNEPDPISYNDTLNTQVFGGYSGEFTIGGSSPDFPGLQAALDAMSDFGMCGPVSLKISPGTYNGQYQLKFTKPESHPLTITSLNNDPESVVLQYTGGNFENPELLRIEGIHQLEVSGLTIQNTNPAATYSRLLNFVHGLDLTVDNAIFNNPHDLSSTSNAELILTAARQISVTNSSFSGGSYGLYNLQPFSTQEFPQYHFEVSGNTFINQRNYGVYAEYPGNVNINRNTVHYNQSFSNFYSAFYLFAPANYTDHQIFNNNIHLQKQFGTCYGIYATGYTGQVDKKFRVYNNSVHLESGTNTSYGIMLSGIAPGEVDFNTIKNSGESINNVGLYISGGTSVIRNNIFAGAGSSRPLGMIATSVITGSHNNFHSPDGILAGNFSNSMLAFTPEDLAFLLPEISQSTFYNAGLVIMDNILYPRHSGLKGTAMPIAGISFDLLDEPRNSTNPDLGVVEFPLLPLDAGIDGLSEPGKPFAAGIRPQKVILRNHGQQALTSVTIGWKMGDAVQSPHMWTGNLASGDTASVTIGQFNFPQDTVFNLTAWTLNPNNAADGNPENDTLTTGPIGAALIGTYNIGGISADFNHLTDAVSALNQLGIAGAVHFSVLPGTYTGTFPFHYLTVNDQPYPFSISGTEGVEIHKEFSSQYYGIFDFKNVRHVSISDLSFFKNTTGGGIVLREGSQHFVIEHCHFNMSSSNIGAVTASAHPNQLDYNSGVSHVVVRHNTFEGAGASVRLLGEMDTGIAGHVRVDSNTFDNAASAINIYSFDSVTVTANEIQSYFAGGNMVDVRFGSGLILEKNIINASSFALVVIDFGPLADMPLRVVNNMISSRTSTGLYLGDVQQAKVYHNSVLAPTAVQFRDLITGMDFRNNIVSSSNFYVIYDDTESLSSFTHFNYNLYHRHTEPYNFYFNGVNHTGIGALQTNYPGSNQNSHAGDPVFTSPTDLHAYSWLAYEKADPTVGVSTDIDGDPRPLSPSTLPDIGADEFILPANDAALIELVHPVMPFAKGVQPISLVLRNMGAAPLTGLQITWTSNGASQPLYQYSGNLGQTLYDTVTIGSLQFDDSEYQSLHIIASLPNGQPDANPLNDTLHVDSLIASMSGVYTVGGSNPDFINPAAAAAALAERGVADTVWFMIRPGTYSQPFVLGNSGQHCEMPVYFQSESGNASDVVINGNTTSPHLGLITINGGSGYNFHNLTMEGTNNRVFEIKAGAGCITVDGCIINGAATTSLNGTVFHLLNTGINEINITKNTIAQGSYILYGASAPQYVNFSHNTIMQYRWGVYLAIAGNFSITYNNFSNEAGTGAPVYISGGQGQSVIRNNYIQNSSNYTLFVSSYNSGNQPDNQLHIYNNYLESMSAGSNFNPVYYDANSRNVSFHHNTIRRQHTNNYNPVYLSTPFAYFFRNNLVSSTTAGPLMYLQNVDSLFHASNNGYHLVSGNLYHINGTEYADLEAVQNVIGTDNQSIQVDPAFLQLSGPETKNIDLALGGTPIPGVTTDIFNNPRSLQSPSIGALEIEPYNLDLALLDFIGPMPLFPSGSHDVNISVQNGGATNITGFTLNWSVNGVPQTPYIWTGVLTPGQKIESLSIASVNFEIAQLYQFDINIATVNGSAGDDFSDNNAISSQVLSPALCGTYTLGAVNSDFESFSQAAQVMSTAGVFCPVQFNVQSGTYLEQVVFENYPGMDAGHPVVFESASQDSSTVWLRGTPTPTDNYVVRFMNASHITFKNMSIGLHNPNTSTTRLVWITNGESRNLAFQHVQLEGFSVNSTSVNFDLINKSGNARVPGFTVANSFLQHGATAIDLNGTNNITWRDSNVIIQNNLFEGQRYGAVYMINQHNSVIENNTIRQSYNYPATGAVYPIYQNNVFGTLINGNKIYAFNAGNSAYLYLNGLQSLPGHRSMIVNNFISMHTTGASAGMQILSTDSMYVVHNTVINPSNNTNSDALQLGSNSNVYLYNNNFVATGTGRIFRALNNAGVIIGSDYNNWYSANDFIFSYKSLIYSDLEDWQQTYNLDLNSISSDPFFTGPQTYQVSNLDLNNTAKPLSYVSEDIEGQERHPQTPDIGCWEFGPTLPVDAALVSLESPKVPFLHGNQPVQVKLRNDGTQTLTQTQIHWKVNGINQQPLTWTGSLASEDTVTVSIGTYNFAKTTKHDLVAWVHNPNGIPDPNPANDTINYEQLWTALTGSYTLGGVAPDFFTWQNLTDNAHYGGILAPATVNVRNNVYEERVSFARIPGTNENRVLTIQSQNLDNTLVALEIASPNAANNYVLNLYNTRNIVFRHIKFKSATIPNNWQKVVEIHGTAGNVSFEHCHFENNLTSLNDNTDARNLVHVFGIENDKLTFVHNHFENGSRGLNLQGVSTSERHTNIEIAHNSFYNQRGRSLYTQHVEDIIIEQNEFITDLGAAYAVEMNQTGGFAQFTRNFVDIFDGNYAVYINGSVTSASNPFLIANNFITHRREAGATALWINGGSNMDIVFNSVHQLSNNNFGYGYYLNIAANTNVKFANNIAKVSGPGFAIGYGVSPGNLAYLNHNNYFTTEGAALIRVSTTAIPTLSQFQTTYSRDLNSKNLDPLYVGVSDLHVQQIGLAGAGITWPGVTIDFDGEERNPNFPDIGADEFEFLGSNIGITEVIFPESINCYLDSAFNISVRIQNFGGIPVSGFDVGYTLNGGLPILENVNALLVAPGESEVYTFSNTEPGLPYGSHNLTAYTLLLNDEGPENDTLTYSFTHMQPLTTAPGNMVPADGFEGAQIPVALSWSAVPGAAGYRLFIWKDGDPIPATPQVNNTANLSINYSSGLQFGETYNWFIRAHNACSFIDSEVSQFTTRLLPDLIVTNISNPVSIFSGQQLTISWTVQNTGQGSTLNQTWWDRVRISPDPDLVIGTTLGNVSNLTALDVGEGYVQTQAFNVPINLTGTYYITVQTDVYNQVPETNAQNNTGASAIPLEINLTPPPDLQVTQIIKPNFAFSGTNINVQFTVSNEGSTPTQVGTWLDRIQMADNQNGINKTLLKNVPYGGGILSPGQSYTKTESVNIPQGIFGHYYIYVSTDVNNVVFEHAFSANNTTISDSIEILLIPPVDLVVSSISVPPSVSPNQSFNVNWQVTNQGGSATNVNYWIDRLFTNTQPGLTGSAVYLANQNVSGVVGPGESYTRNRTLKLPVNTTAGENYLVIHTNAYGHVYEFNLDTNNVSFTPFNVVLPDLKPISISGPASDTTGNVILVTYTNSNQGPGIVAGRSWHDRIYLAASDTFPATGAIQVGQYQRTNQTWQVGHTVTYSPQITIPHGLEGPYFLYVKTDINQTITESDESNNWVRSVNPIMLVQGPVADLVTTELSAPDSVISGVPFTITVTVENAGTGPALPVWQDKLFTSPLPQWAGIQNAMERISLPRNTELEPGESYSYSFQLTIPPAPAGVDEDQFFLYYFADAGNHVFEFNNTNNISAGIPIIVQYFRPDFAVTLWETPDSAGTGEQIQVYWQVENLDADNLSQYTEWKDGVYLSTTPSITGSSILLEEVDIITEFYPNTNQYYVQLGLSLPQQYFGNLFLIVKADHNNITGDSNPANNVAVAPIHITLSPVRDLVVSNFVAPVSVISGQPFQVVYTVTNQGDGPTLSGGWIDRLYLTQGGAIASNTPLLGSKVRSGNLNAGASYTDTLSVFVPVNSNGNYVLNLFTDATNLEYEHMAEHNNQFTYNISAVQPPPADLVATDIFMPDQAMVNQPVNIQWTIFNIGANTAQGNMREAVYLSTDPEWSLNDYLVGVYDVNINIPSQGTMLRQISTNIPGLPAGDYYVIVRTDVRNNIYESNTDNNTSASVNTINIDMPEMILDTWYEHTLANTNKVYYKLNIPESLSGESLIVESENNSASAINELYMRYQLVPTKASFDYQQDDFPKPEPQLIVPSLQAGTYYLMAEANNYTPGSYDFNLKARILEFEITTVQPDKGGNTGKVTTLLRGAKYTPNMTAWLTTGYLELKADTIFYMNPTLVFATFDLSQNGGMPLGFYDVELRKPTGEVAVKSDGFEVVQGGPEQILTVYGFPSAVMVPRSTNIAIELTNAGLNDVPAQKRVLFSLNNAPIGMSHSELAGNMTDAYIEFEEHNGPPGVIRPGVSVTRHVMTRISWPGVYPYMLIDVTHDEDNDEESGFENEDN